MANWFPSVLWHCWFGRLAYKNRPRNDLLCVEWDVKPYTHTHPPKWKFHRQVQFVMRILLHISYVTFWLFTLSENFLKSNFQHRWEVNWKQQNITLVQGCSTIPPNTAQILQMAVFCRAVKVDSGYTRCHSLHWGPQVTLFALLPFLASSCGNGGHSWVVFEKNADFLLKILS